MEIITEREFLKKAQQEDCQADLSERLHAVSPRYMKYVCSADDLLRRKTYPTWRTNKDATKYIGAYEVPRDQAFLISFIELARKPQLFSQIKFNERENYLKSSCIIVFRCEGCGVHVIKDGNHRLLQCAFHKISAEFTVYQVVSVDWKSCKVDMKNFCECSSAGLP